MKGIKKILALVLVAMMAMGMVSALADAVVPAATGTTTIDIPIVKTVYFYNNTGADVYEPNITYTYTITPADPNATVTGFTADTTDDPANTATVSVKAGPWQAINGATNASGTSVNIAYSITNPVVTGVDKNGIAVTKRDVITLDRDGFKFDDNGAVDKTNGVLKAGVYRYVITETINLASVEAAGLTPRNGYVTTRYLDVYVTNDGNVAAVLLEDEETATDGDNTDVTTTTKKTNGFGDEPDPGDDDPSDTDPTNSVQTNNDFSSKVADGKVDRYTTYNVSVQKTTSGSMADASNKFGFNTAITNSITGAKYTYYTVNDTTGIGKVVGTDDASGIPDALKSNEIIYIKGIPSNQTAATPVSVTVTETNNTADVYTTTATKAGTATDLTTASAPTGTGTTTGATATVYAGKTVATGALSIKEYDTDNSTANAIIINNALDNPSPTGLVLRFGPYVAMFAAGVVLFIILGIKRRKSEEE